MQSCAAAISPGTSAAATGPGIETLAIRERRGNGRRTGPTILNSRSGRGSGDLGDQVFVEPLVDRADVEHAPQLPGRLDIPAKAGAVDPVGDVVHLAAAHPARLLDQRLGGGEDDVGFAQQVLSPSRRAG